MGRRGRAEDAAQLEARRADLAALGSEEAEATETLQREIEELGKALEALRRGEPR